MYSWCRISNRGRMGAVVNPVLDPISGQPESKQTPVCISAWPTQWQALVLSRGPLHIAACDYQVKVKGEHYWRYHLAGQTAGNDWPAWSRALLNHAGQDSSDWLEYSDRHTDTYRAATVSEDRLQSCVFISARGRLPEPGWLCSLFGKSGLTRKERLSLLSGFPLMGEEDVGRTVCSCFNVGDITILKAIEKYRLASVDAICHCLSAGTGCGSCLPELKVLLHGSNR